MINAEYWIALQTALGYGSPKISKILENYESVIDFFEDKPNWKRRKIFNDKQLSALKSVDLKASKKVIDCCINEQIKILTLDDDDYPAILKRIKNPPAVLYVKGELPNFDEEVGIGMVGTRDCSMNGKIVAATLAYRIAQAGGIVVSGGAHGIDTKCSQGALFAQKPSVIIRPCGLLSTYLSELEDTRRDVEKIGAVISEIQPRDKMPRNAFHIRNRLIPALSLGLAVVECPMKSGVLITVSYALEMGKDVYVLPGDISDDRFSGSNKLLQDGALPVYSASDVLNEYIFAFPHKLKLDNARIPINEDDIYLRLQKKYSRNEEQVKNNVEIKEKPRKSIIQKVFGKQSKKRKEKLTELPFKTEPYVKNVYDCFGDEPVDTDYLIKKSGLKVAEVLFAITELELNDLIDSLPGGRYEIK